MTVKWAIHKEGTLNYALQKSCNLNPILMLLHTVILLL